MKEIIDFLPADFTAAEWEELTQEERDYITESQTLETFKDGLKLAKERLCRFMDTRPAMKSEISVDSAAENLLYELGIRYAEMSQKATRGFIVFLADLFPESFYYDAGTKKLIRKGEPLF